MTGKSVLELNAAPAAVVGADGVPAAGRFIGRCGEIDWRKLGAQWRRSPLWRHFHHKRWHYIGIAAPDCFIGCAVVDIGWTNAAFAYLFDRDQRCVTGAMSRDGLPGLTAKVSDLPLPGRRSHFAMLGDAVEIAESSRGRFALTVRGPKGFAVDVEIDNPRAVPWMLACNAVEGGVWHATHKSTAMAVQGHAVAGGKRYALDGAWASQDHSNGLLPRDTRWLWASAHGETVGFNLQSGYFGNNENALWLDGKLIPLGAAQFQFDPADTQAPWQVHTDDGLLDLRFQPEGERREDRNLLVAATRYVQPVGTFSGTVRATVDAPQRRVEGLLGVVEQHASRW